ncbi:conserved exported hypothetical protein [Candidatus Terasakiella magnetica]|uniref:Glycoside-hydrolase family GH114 TIM-barrel domain-containing protein n=1 Tax=Candidatus Terasakiella magnetica TaxID=1867952 RepID=A0A1C3RDD4_9PROT|nr:hypothetical protein [Candidatus Terasakiella magnetica]SCA55224.1 conserved exported hypothetical protein [Candidatus Terasakiella magnetica]
MKRSVLKFCTTALVAFTMLSSTASAQVISQGKILTDGEEDSKAIYTGPNIDYSHEMRRLVQNIAKYGRKFKRDFIVLTKGGRGLLTKVIDVDQLITSPSSVYLQTIDGVIQPNLSYGLDGFGEALTEKEQGEILQDLQVAKDTGLNVFTLDFASKPKDVDKAIRFATKNKFIPYVAPGMGMRNNKLPNWPKRPYKENAHTITNAQSIKNYVLIDDSSRFGTASEYAMKIHNTNYDMVITPVFHHRSQTLGRHNVRKMQFKKLGARRPVLAYIDIGAADVGAYYWKENWRMGNPSWVLDLAPSSSDKYLVQYWHPSWHQVLYGNNMSFLYGIMKEGYDGIVLDGIYAHELFENPE